MDPTAQLQTTLRTVEQACAAIQMHSSLSEAEASLLALRSSHKPYQACQYILEKSQMASARFQAAAILQEAALREWTILSAEEKNGLWMYCLQYAMACPDGFDRYVQVKVFAAAAVLIKRGWFEFSEMEKDSLFSKIKEAVLGTHGLTTQYTGITFLDCLISEFSVGTASSLDLPAEFHSLSQVSFQNKYLQPLYSWVQQAAFNVSHGVLKGSDMEIKVCTVALHLMCQVLTWDFCNSVHGTRNPVSILQPGPAWKDLLISSQSINWILDFYLNFRQHMSQSWSWVESPIAVSCRQLIVQLCCLKGSIFPADNNQSQEQHLQRLFSGIIRWLDPPYLEIGAIRSGKGESELIDICRAFQCISSSCSPSAFNELLNGYPRYSGAVEFLSLLTCEVIQLEVEKEYDDKAWVKEVLNILLETWTALLQPVGSSKKLETPQVITVAAHNVFRTMLEARLKDTNPYDEEDSSEELQTTTTDRDEQLYAFALIGRAASATTIPLLASTFSETCSSLDQTMKLGNDPIPTLEKLYWLLRICGHVLADSSNGETPMVPEDILKAFSNIADPNHHPVVILSWHIINFALKCLDPSMRETMFSARLMESIVWFLARWTCTYLMPLYDCDQHYASEFAMNDSFKVFGEEHQGKAVLQTLVYISTTALTSWPGEHRLQELTCFQLLPAFVKKQNICAHLHSLEPWSRLANAFVNEKTLLQLKERLQRSLAEALCLSACSMENSDAATQYTRDLIRPFITYLVDLSQNSKLHSFAEKPDILCMVCCLLERLRGAARSTGPRNQRATFEMGVSTMQPLIVFLEVYKHHPSVVYILLKFMVDWVEGQLPFLDVKETATLFSFCVKLLQVYSAHNIGKISISTSRNLLNEMESERYKDLLAMVQLLHKLCARVLVDSSSGSRNEIPDIVQVLHLGFDILTPLISPDLLKYPKLCSEYFSLLDHMFSVYPEKVAKMASATLEQIVRTLDFGLSHQDTEVVSLTLSALNNMASYHYQEKCKGEEGLGVLVSNPQGPNGMNNEGVLSHFLKSLVKLLLFDDYSYEIVGPSAEALLPLILCDPELYQRIVNELIQSQKNVQFHSRLEAAFHAFLGSKNLTLDRPSRVMFVKNLYKLLADVRCILRTI